MKEILDVTSISTILGTFMQLLPPIAALFAIIYYAFKIYDRIKYGPKSKK